MEDLLITAVDRMTSEGAEFCDAKHQVLKGTSIRVVDASVRTLTEQTLGGVCFRARIGGSWGYATTVELDRKSILEACVRAAKNAKLGGAKGKKIPDMPSSDRQVRANVRIHTDSVPIEEKLAYVGDLDKAQKIDSRVVNSNSDYRDEVRTNTLVNSFGSSLKWEEVRVRLIAFPVASGDGRREMFFEIVDGTRGFELIKGKDVMAMGKSAGEEATKMLAAKKPPSGFMTCISDPKISGTLAHEVMGHASEADEIVKRRSFLTGAVGKRVASEQITMVDNGTIEGAFGTIPFDDEGTPSSRTVIIKDGIYKGYMQDLETAGEMGVTPTGNGRAQDFGRRVWVRMTNTFFEAGDWTLEEMIEDIKFGVLADRSISGMEDPVGGGFEAKTLRGFIIENGKITDLIRSFTLTGSALDILKTTDAVGDEVQLDGGNCGKGIEDFVPVSSGGPYCRSRLLVGGG
ncbi:MAG: TldD/PmbA family protein [Methanomassiliicoccales archaeon]|nr:TldD/PmbA family protein [Methanomassiliicoccales archaeon]